MSRYHYGDLILEALMEFRRPMAMDEVVDYVAEMTDKTILEVRLPVDNTLTAAWLHGFVIRENDLYSLPVDNYLACQSPVGSDSCLKACSSRSSHSSRSSRLTFASRSSYTSNISRSSHSSSSHSRGR